MDRLSGIPKELGISMSKLTPKPENLASLIFFIRGEKVLLDTDLAVLYGVEARALNQAVSRNRNRFPDDFMFQISTEEYEHIRSRFVTASDDTDRNSSQSVMSTRKHRGLAYRPYAFTEQGVAMLSSVLRSPRAVEVNIAIMRTFVQLRRLMDSNRDLARKIESLEMRYDEQFSAIFDAIKQLSGQITADLFADFNGIPKDADKTEFYQHDQNWTNRMILGDSLQVMASLAEREGLRGKVQCIYFDPPYGIKFNSNFQWSTTSRDVRLCHPPRLRRGGWRIDAGDNCSVFPGCNRKWWTAAPPSP